MRRWVSLLLVLAMPIADSALAQDCGGGSGDGVCCGDLNGDGIITSADLAIAEADFGCAGCCNGDVNFDGVVDCNDLNIIHVSARRHSDAGDGAAESYRELRSKQ